MKIDAHHHFWGYNPREYDWIDDSIDDALGGSGWKIFDIDPSGWLAAWRPAMCVLDWEAMQSFAPLLPHLDRYGCFTSAGLRESYRKGSIAANAADILLKGPEQRLPQGLYFHDKEGQRREEVRLRWWDQNATTFRKAALGMDGRENEIPDSRLPTDYRFSAQVRFYTDEVRSLG